MCGRFDTSHLTWVEIYDQLKQFGRVVSDEIALEPNPDVRPTTQQVTARLQDGGWIVEKMRWGLVPFWRNGKPIKDTAKGAGDGFKITTFNCRIETCTSAATFKHAFAKRRCIVPASAWYEWTDEQGGKVKHRFARTDGHPIWFAGLWDRCTASDQGEVTSFTIMTGPSAGKLSDYHTRAPVILEPDEWLQWLDPSQDAEALMASVRPERFEVSAA
jgi:putative SOS response-associated peptidase YedK